MGFFSSSPEGISKYKWENEVRLKLYSSLSLSRERWTMLDGLFSPFLRSNRGISSSEIEYQIAWLRKNFRLLPCHTFSEKDIDILEEVLNEFNK